MSADDLIAFLRANPVFAELPVAEIATLAGMAREERKRAREFVFMEGDRADWLWLVRAGRVKIVRHSKTGRDVVLEILGPGEIFGAVAVMERRPYPAAAQVIEPAVVVKVPAAAVVAASERHSALVRGMALMMGRRLRAAHDSVESLAVDPVEARLAAVLLRLVERDGTREGKGFALPFHLTRQSLADMTGTTVETAIRVLGRWIRDGIVLDDGGRLVIRDTARLREVATGD
jgi:CRP/FNR family transcriptional regulator